jgi:hypothetical protein
MNIPIMITLCSDLQYVARIGDNESRAIEGYGPTIPALEALAKNIRTAAELQAVRLFDPR